MKLGIFTTTHRAREREELYDEAIACYRDLADEVVEVDDEWPEEFDWPLIGEMFQRGYERTDADWVIHADLDYFFHEDDFERIRQVLHNSDAPGMSFWKYQFYLPSHYTLKSRLVIAVNKRLYGGRIKFNGGEDLCQPTLDGELLSWQNMPEAKVPFYCYDALLKTEEQHRQDRARFARAYHRHFGRWGHGHADTALEDWLEMAVGRFKKHQPFSGSHPKYVRERILSLRPEQFGHSGWGHLSV